MSGAGFGSTIVLKLTGVTYRRLDYWARTGLVGSSIRQAAGRGSRRVCSFQDLVALRVVARLLDAGVSLQTVRRAVEHLKRHTERRLNTLGLVARVTVSSFLRGWCGAQPRRDLRAAGARGRRARVRRAAVIT